MDPVIHFEFPYDDRERITRFYQAAFGWEMQMMGPEMGDYVLAITSRSSKPRDGAYPGSIDGGFFKRTPEMAGQVLSVVIEVKDLRASMKKVNEAGGEVLGEPMEIPGVGTYVPFHDTERNRIGMLQSSRR